MTSNSSSRPTLSSAERERRWGLARTFMKKEGLDAIVIFGEHEDAGAAPYTIDNWFTNDRPGVMIVFPRNGDPIVLMPLHIFVLEHMEAAARGEDLWIKPDNIRLGRYSDSLVKILKELDLIASTIGVLGLEPAPPVHPEGTIPYSLWSAVTSQLPTTNFKPVGGAFVPLTMVLGPEEVTMLQHTASIGDKMVRSMVESTGIGVSESQIVAAGTSAAILEGTSVPMMHLNSGPQAVMWGVPRWTYRPQAPRTIENGDLISSEIFCNFGMRQIQLQCTIAVGEVHEDVERAATIARAAYEAGLRMLRAGVRFADVADAMLQPVKEAGGWAKGPQIHSLNPILAVCGTEIDMSRSGLAVGKYPRVTGHGHFGGDLVLQPGMSFALEPSCGFGPRVVTLGGSAIVTKGEPIELNPHVAQLLRA